MMIGEVGSSEQGGSKAAWIARSPRQRPAPNTRGSARLLWFDKFDGGMDWPIETSAAATAAFAKGVGTGVRRQALRRARPRPDPAAELSRPKAEPAVPYTVALAFRPTRPLAALAAARGCA